MADAKLTPEVEAVLRASTITGNQLGLPAGRLERKLYEAVNKVIVNAGGKWNKGAQAHIFDRDPRVKLNLTLETGVAIDQKKKLQAFFTPKPIAERVIQFACIKKGMTVLEPSAGIGMLALEARDAGGIVDCIEIDPDNCEALRRLNGPREVLCGDFLTVMPNFLYDRVVMNPPFTKRQDVKHVVHAMKFLKEKGRLVAIMMPNTDVAKLQALFPGRIVDLVKIDAGAFKKSGTNIATAIVTMQ